jgi:hypothetical protein
MPSTTPSCLPPGTHHVQTDASPRLQSARTVDTNALETDSRLIACAPSATLSPSDLLDRVQRQPIHPSRTWCAREICDARHRASQSQISARCSGSTTLHCGRISDTRVDSPAHSALVALHDDSHTESQIAQLHGDDEGRSINGGVDEFTVVFGAGMRDASARISGWRCTCEDGGCREWHHTRVIGASCGLVLWWRPTGTRLATTVSHAGRDESKPPPRRHIDVRHRHVLHLQRADRRPSYVSHGDLCMFFV